MTLVVLAGATGLLGVHSGSVTATNGDWSLSITYPRTARAGLDVPWRADVHHTGGLPKTVTLAVSSDYFEMFETQGFYPDASSATNDGQFVDFQFTTPPGDDLVVEYDAYIQPAAQFGKSATVEVLVDGIVQVSTSLHTILVP